MTLKQLKKTLGMRLRLSPARGTRRVPDSSAGAERPSFGLHRGRSPVVPEHIESGGIIFPSRLPTRIKGTTSFKFLLEEES